MPFTFSHPAAIIPLTYLPKRFISITGLVIGSLSPDFEYFLRMKVYSVYSHNWTGLFWFDLPITIIVAFIYHVIVRDKLIDNLPSFLAKRLFIYKNFSWTKYFKQHSLIVIVSCIIGIATHILWDSFTHENGQFVQLYSKLKSPIEISGLNIPLYKLLQHLSTIIGGLILIYVLFKLPTKKIVTIQKPTFPFWLSVGLITLAVVIIRLLTGLDYKLYGTVIVTFISSFLIGLFLTTALGAKKNTINQSGSHTVCR